MKHQLLFAFGQFIIDEFTDHKMLIAAIIIGMIAGLVAQLVLPGRGHGLVATAVIGWISCFLSIKFVMSHVTFVQNHIVREFIGALVVAMVITLSVNLVYNPERAKEKK